MEVAGQYLQRLFFNDHLLLTGKFGAPGGKDDPEISATYLLTNCLKNCMGNGCSGGQPTAALKWILTNGIAQECCLNYDWYPKNTNSSNNLSEGSLNNLIPKKPDNQNQFGESQINSCAHVPPSGTTLVVKTKNLISKPLSVN